MNNRLLTTILILVAAIGLIGWYMSSKGTLPGGRKEGEKEKRSEWQAVFLTNGQVYFGKLSGESNRLVTLREVYYLQLAQAPQPEEQKSQTPPPQISLVKLGQELHGPVDEMRINRDHILFIEDMKNSAKVVEAIERYKKEGPQAQTSVSPVPATASPRR